MFVDETGPKERRVKRLAMMDQDGANVRYLTRGEELVLTPRFSPTSPEITYMAYGEGDPRIYLLNIVSGEREIVGNFPEHELFAAVFAERPGRHHEPAGRLECQHIS